MSKPAQISNDEEQIAHAFIELVRIIAKLRDPNGGCPWDLKQTHQSLKPYMIEEAYEALDAIDAVAAGKAAPSSLSEELGDVLLQVMLHAQVAVDQGHFSIVDVIGALSKKLIARHPHVFGSERAETADEVLKNWERLKQNDREGPKGVLDGVPRSMPSLLKAQRMGEKVSRVGFDWDTLAGVREKVLEEIKEFLDEYSRDGGGEKMERAQEEFGDVLFSLAQWARKAGINSEEALQAANDKFKRRFAAMERNKASGFEELTAAAWQELWDAAKQDDFTPRK